MDCQCTEAPNAKSVSKIPPVYERQTASNISIEHRVEVKGLESCNLKPLQSSASRGVRSRQQQEADLFAPVKVETIPLLSPNMEAELLREPWTFPREPASCVVAPRAAERAAAEEAASADLSAWEENFQDLSGWCMANIPARCDFPTGESTMATKITGTRNEGSVVLTAAEGTTRGLMQAIEKKTMSGGDAIVGTRRPESVTGVVLPQLDHAYQLAGHQLQQQQQQQQQQMYFSNENNISGKSMSTSNLKSSGNVWMGPRKARTAVATNNNNIINNNSNTAAWQTLKELGIAPAASGSSIYQQQSATLDYNVKLQEPEEQCDNQDILQTFETDATNGFDLLSYLWEVDVPSPGDSVSTDSSRITDTKSLPRVSSNPSAHVVVSPRTYEPISLTRSKASDGLASRLQAADSPCSLVDSPKHSPVSSASSELATTSRSGYQLRPSIVKIEKPESPPMERRSGRARRTRANSNASRASSARSSGGRGRKREFSDSEDDEGYRETREKNNEASRKSRMNKKAKEVEMAKRAVELEKDNRILKMKVEELEKLVSSMRNALLRSALKREVKADNMF